MAVKRQWGSENTQQKEAFRVVTNKQKASFGEFGGGDILKSGETMICVAMKSECKWCQGKIKRKKRASHTKVRVDLTLHHARVTLHPCSQEQTLLSIHGHWRCYITPQIQVRLSLTRALINSTGPDSAGYMHYLWWFRHREASSILSWLWNTALWSSTSPLSLFFLVVY